MDSLLLFIFLAKILTSGEKKLPRFEAASALGTFFGYHHLLENEAAVQSVHEMLRHRTGEEHGENGSDTDSSDSFQEQQREDHAQSDADDVESRLHLLDG